MMDILVTRLVSSTSALPIWVRYVFTVGLIIVAFLGAKLLEGHLQPYPVLLFIPIIFIVSILFDRATGLLATVLAVVLTARYLIPSPLSNAALPLAVFVLIGLCIAGSMEVLRSTLRRLSEAKRYSDVLLEELAHRTRNDLATIVSILRLQARSETNPTVQAAIASAVARVNVVAKVHDRLRDTSDTGRIALAPYVRSLCSSLSEFHRARGVAIRIDCEDIQVRSSQAASIGLIVNELVTNAFKYAFPDRSAGAIEVTVRTKDQRIFIEVRDDGVGCPAEAKGGLGTRLINLLTEQMKGKVDRQPLAKGCEVKVAITMDG